MGDYDVSKSASCRCTGHSFRFGCLGSNCALYREPVGPIGNPKTDTKGKGKFDAKFDTQSKILTYTLTFDGLTGPATAAHIHGPANRSQTAASSFRWAAKTRPTRFPVPPP
jgi:hypothetical protein